MNRTGNPGNAGNRTAKRGRGPVGQGLNARFSIMMTVDMKYRVQRHGADWARRVLERALREGDSR